MHSSIITDPEVVERVRRRFHHPRQCLAVNPRDALRAGDDTRVVAETQCRLRILLLDRLPVLPLEVEQLVLYRCARHGSPPQCRSTLAGWVPEARRRLPK